MRTKARKRVLAWMLTAMLAVTCVPQMAFASETAAAEPAAATVAELTVLDGQVTVKNELATGSVTDGVVTVTAAHGMPTYKTNTVTVHNSTDKKAVVSFDYEVTDYNTTSGINGYTGLDGDKGTFTAVLDAAEYITITITGKRANSGCATLTMNNFAIETVADSSNVTFSYDSSLGSVTAAGAAAATGAVVAADYETGLALNAAAAADAEFLGWVNEATGKVLSREAAFTFKPTADTTVKAVFVNGKSEGHYLVGGTFIVEGLNAAVAKAEALKTNKVIVILNDAVLTAGTYTIPAGVTMLIPFDAENTLYKATPEGVHGEYTTPVAYRTLTLADGAELVVNGEISLSAKHNAATSNTRGSGAPTGNVSFMNLEKGSTVTVKDGGALYAYGYVVGEGTVTAESGAVVYENFQIEDFRGGSATTFMAVTNADKGILPIAQYYVQNIEVPLTLEAGATEYCYTSMYLSSKVLGSSVKFISDEGAMFILEDGYVTKEYDGQADRLIVKGNGDMSLSPIKVELEGQGIDSAAFELPINNNITVDIDSGNVLINQDVALLPGAEINIAEGAVCTLGEGVSVYVYDLDQWGGYCGASNAEVIPVNYAPGKTYDRTVKDLVDAAVRVDGLLDASKGYIYTTTSADYTDGGANVYSTGNGVVITVSGEQETTYQFTQNGTEGTFTEIFLLPVNLKNKDGSYLQTLSIEPGTYVYNNGVWAEGELHSHEYEAVVTAPTCTEGGFTTYTCECGDSYVADETAALGHTEDIDVAVDATCTATGLTEGKHCSVCNEVLTAQEEVAAKGHTPGAAANCTTSQKCTVCGAELAAAVGHKEVTDPAKAATCTETGLKEGKHCSVCNTVLVKQETVPALGHEYGELTVIEKQSCIKEGLNEQACKRCDHKITYVIPMDAHILTEKRIEPTCTETGLKQLVCTGCGEVRSAIDIPALGHKPGAAATCTTSQNCTVCGVELVAALGHKATTKTTPATTGKAGSVIESCTVCGMQLSKTTIAKIGKTTIPAAKFVYNGKVRKPVPTVRDAKGKKLVKDKDYTVTYKNAKATKAATAKNVGKYTVVVTFKGNYKGTVKKQFVINPQGTTLKKLTKPAKKQIKVTWNKRTAQVTGYEIQYSTTKKFTKATTKTVKVMKAKTNSKVIKQLKAKKKYWVKIRTYKTVNGVKYYSQWSAPKTIVTK